MAGLTGWEDPRLAWTTAQRKGAGNRARARPLSDQTARPTLKTWRPIRLRTQEVEGLNFTGLITRWTTTKVREWPFKRRHEVNSAPCFERGSVNDWRNWAASVWSYKAPHEWDQASKGEIRDWKRWIEGNHAKVAAGHKTRVLPESERGDGARTE